MTLMPAVDPNCSAEVTRLARDGNAVVYGPDVRVDIPIAVIEDIHRFRPLPLPVVEATNCIPPVHGAAPVGGAIGHGARPIGSSGNGLSSLGSGSGGSDMLWVGIAVVALVTMPVVAISLAAARSENEHQSASAIDLANAYNELSRTPGSACSAPYQQPPEQQGPAYPTAGPQPDGVTP